MRPLFTPQRIVHSAHQFLETLLGNESRKTAWMRAEAAGDPGPWRQQSILGRGRWDTGLYVTWCVTMRSSPWPIRMPLW